jgi:hypothetical protein
MLLYIFNNGDPSVGIFTQQWEVQCPFNKEDLQDENDEDYFKEKILAMYQEFCEFKLYALYDYELKQDAFDSDYPDYF